MKRKRNSLKFRVLFCCIFSAAVTALLLFIYGAYNVLRYRSDFIATNTLTVNFYANEFDRDVNMLDSYISTLMTDDSNFEILGMKSLKDKSRISAQYYLKNTLAVKASSLDRKAGIFYYDQDRESLISEYSNYGIGYDKYGIDQELKKYLSMSKEKDLKEIASLANEQYFVRARLNKGRLVGYLINLSQWFQGSELSDMQLAFTDEQGSVITQTGEQILLPEKIEKAFSTNYTNGLNYIIVKTKTAIGAYLVMIRPFWQFLYFWKDAKIFLFLLVIPAIGVIPLVLLYRYFRTILFVPTDRILERVRSGEKIEDTDSTEDMNELSEIEEKINEILDTSTKMQTRIYEAQLEESRMQLQNYKLQLKPHFYLNCLKSMDAYIEKKDYQKLKLFTVLLAEYLRMRFREVELTEELQEELKIVDTYSKLQSVLSEQPIFCSVSQESGTEKCMVPTFCIQTFVENANKYAKAPDRVLMIQVRIRRTEMEGTSFLMIQIQDNGKGFESELLKKYNRAEISQEDFDSEHIGIHNLRYRFWMLYGEKAKLVFYNSAGGGAVIELYIPTENCDKEELQTLRGLE